MYKKYSKKKRVNGGNIITRRSNHSRISTALPLKTSLNRLRSNQKRQLHPKVSTTTSKLAVSEKSSTKPSEDDFMKTYILYTYSNDKDSRESVGIDHPLLKDVSVSDYMNAIDNALSNLSNNVYKSKKEKENEIRESKHIWEKIQSVLNGPDGESPSRYKTQQKQTRKIQKPPLRGHSIGGAAAGPAANSPDDQAEEEFNFSQEQSAIQLNQRLTFEKLMNFIDLSSRASKPAWKNRASMFMKYMFFDPAEFICQVGPDNTLTGRVPRDKRVNEYSFSISTSTYLRVPNVSHRTLIRGPPFAFLMGSVSGSVERVRLVEIAPTLMMSSHNATSTIQFNVSMFKGRFNTMSNIQRRHYIYCIILFVLMRATEAQLQTIIDEINTEKSINYLHLEAVVKITKHFSDRNENDTLPYNLFFNRATIQGNRVIPSNITMIFLDQILEMESATITEPAYHDIYNDDNAYVGRIVRLPVGYSKRYFELLHYIYRKIIHIQPNEDEEDVFMFDIQHQVPDQLVNKLTITPIGFQEDTSFAFYMTLKNSNDVTFYTHDDPNVGIIKHASADAFFYRNISSSTIGFIPNGWFFQRWLSRQPTITDKDIMQTLPLSRKIWTVKSRTTDIRDKIMGYLSHLVYYPNDVIENVSVQLFNKTIQGNSFIYVGPFDKDPTYPLSTTGSDTYSRVHVWLKVIPGAGGELYVVTRGSKTGYDWDSADSDIQNGILNSQRSLHMGIVLREIIEYLNACLTPHSGQGSQQLRNMLIQLKGKSIQIYSSGHSLGGYLSLSLAHSSFCMNLINGFSFRYISGIAHASRRKNRDQVISLNSYIIPIVFDPYVVSTPIMNAFSFLPYARIHSCIDSDFSVEPPQNQVVNIERLHRLYPFSQTTRLRYDDVASAFFLAYLRKKHSIQHFYDTMGRFSIFHYKNIYNVFENFIYHDTYYFGGGIKRTLYDGRTSHNLSQIIGIVPEYIFSYMFQTKLLISTPSGLAAQSLQAAHYTFPVPTTKQIVPSIQSYRGPTSLFRRSNYIRYQVQDASREVSSCVSKLTYAVDRSHYRVISIEPQTNVAFTAECVLAFQTDIDDFINSPF